MDLDRYQLSRTVTIARPPEVLHAMVADVTRMGEWSPVNTGGAWDDDTHRWFTGRNEVPGRIWETRCRVDADEPGAEFTFVVCGGEAADEYIRWSYRFVPAGDGTEVTESWQPLPDYLGLLQERFPDDDHAALLAERRRSADEGIATTLANLKQVAEAG